MATLGTLCRCLTTYERSRGDRCVHDSWGRRSPSPDRSWASPHRDLPPGLFLLALAAWVVLFLGLLFAGRAALCEIDPTSHSYCDGYVAPTTSEETS